MSFTSSLMFPSTLFNQVYRVPWEGGGGNKWNSSIIKSCSTISARLGLLEVFCKCLLENLERLPGDARTMVGVLTYDSSLHFYNLNVSGRSQSLSEIIPLCRDLFRGGGGGGAQRAHMY